ncbi:solute carrier family 25 member 44a [Gadus chalcogrammus]|uniref:solute carrier family 25 member 44a n=1 Tax=Gadus chalcogrammus TaxID=1042646 RepID=UPI0024C4BEB6|nr:solute carrier family 25 member 44a [Gadus chalcogrammus]XP_056454668.1 solute carrier family 25 member 44a [Gadus chalcogrammus]
MQQKGTIQIIEWEDLDKRKFYSLGVFMTMTTRLTVYPASLIRTLLQVQRGKALYTGTLDAFCKILRAEGLRGLYRGFMVSTFTLVSGQAYITTYELVRKHVSRYSPSNTVKSLVAGGAASLVAQTITVPIDVVSQQLMMQGQGEHLTRFKVKAPAAASSSSKLGRFSFGQTRDIVVQICAADGFRGFYRGYVASLLTYIPNSALWWPFYHFYSERLSNLAPSNCPQLMVLAVAGPMAAATASTITNPMDVVRARVQVEGRSSVIDTFKQLLAEEGARGMTKGLSARIIAAMPTSVLIVVGYESLKRLSLRADLVESRHW